MPSLTPEQRRADALIAMVHHHQITKQAPSSGGDRPRVIVKLDYAKLHAGAAGAGLIPAVLGGPSEILDVGREHRLVTPAMHTALIVRDGGCTFPTCSTRAAVGEAHHVVPWWAGGGTTLSNLVLVCKHHHGIVEPSRYGTRDQWEVRIATDGVPEFIPPVRARSTTKTDATRAS